MSGRAVAWVSVETKNAELKALEIEVSVSSAQSIDSEIIQITQLRNIEVLIDY